MRIVVVVVLLMVLAVTGSAHGATQGCDAATATPLVQELDTNPRVVWAVHCGAFLGPGSEAMIVVISSQGGCHSVMGWRAFARAGGGWQAVGGFNAASDVRVEATTVVEWRQIHRRGDWLFCGGPTGGEQERSWTWNGAALAPGAWAQTVPAQPKGEVYFAPRDRTKYVGVMFYAARLPVLCLMLDGTLSYVSCQYRREPFSRVKMSPSGRLRTCEGSRRCAPLGDPGIDDLAPPLKRNRSVAIGRFRCRAEPTKMRCVVIETGKGFVLDRRGPRAVR
jgi:hypothetical protein